MLNKEQQKKLLKIARQTLEAYIKEGKIPQFGEKDPELLKPYGAFVTLRKGKELRGCIGHIIGSKPLYELIRDMAIASSTQDPRFPPVTEEELKSIKIEISVLSEPKLTKGHKEIELGKHGVIVQSGFNQGVYLPQVATETGWKKEQFLSSLCLHKAGLPADAWKNKDTNLYIFEAEVFEE